MRRLQLEHTLDQIFEVIREELIFSRLCLAMSSPEKIRSVRGNHFVERVLLLLSLVEWRMLSDKNEEDGSGSEDVNC